MLQACPYKDPDRLVCVDETDLPERTARNFTSLAGFRDWRQQQQVFEPLVGALQWDGSVRTSERSEKTRAYFVSEGFFSTLGAEPLIGRTFFPEDYEVGAARVIVLSHDHWRRWFGADPNAVGQTIIFEDQVCTVVGILPEGFRWIFQGVACGLWMPLVPERIGNWNRDFRGLRAIGRLKPGVSGERAQAQMNLIAERLARAYPEKLGDRGIKTIPMNEAYAWMATRSGEPRALAILLAVVVSVLLIACLHVASLLIARSGARDREIAVRSALGAHRLRLMRQLLTESLLLGLLGGLLGAVLAYWSLAILATVRGQSIPWYLGNHMDRLIPWFVDIRTGVRPLLYVTAISLLTCVAFGLLPAIGASRTNLNRSLSTARTSGHAPRFYGLRAALVVFDIAVSLVLLTGAGLMVKSYGRILRIDPRVNTKNILATSVELGRENARYAEPQQRHAFSRQLVERVGQLPGVECVALANGTPAWAGYSGDTFHVEGSPPDAEGIQIRHTPVSIEYFRVLEIPLLAGRYFTEHDNTASTPVALISESLARCLWPDESPLGKHLTHGRSERITRQIVGIVRDVKHFGDFPDEEVYVPLLQTDGLRWPDVMVRTRPGAGHLATAVRREILGVDPEVIVSDVVLLERMIADLFFTERFSVLFLGGFAILALLLASIGVYGTTAYTVARRTHEIGVRMALGAATGDVLRTVLCQGLKLMAIGIAIGLVGALAATRIIRSLLHDISPTDPLTFVCVSLLLTGAAMLACYLPARRAARIDPMQALRYE